MSATDERSGVPDKRRPGWVWAISIFCLLGTAFTVMSYAIVMSGAFPLPEEQQTYYASLTPVDHALLILIGLLNVTAAVFLFLLRRQAFVLFVTSFALGLLATLWQIVARHWLTAITGPGLIGAVIGWSLSLAIILYTRSLVKRGVLT